MDNTQALQRDLRFLHELVQTHPLEPLRRDLPVQLKPGVALVDLDRFISALRADFAAALAALPGTRSPAIEASARAAQGLVQALRELLEGRESEAAGREVLAELG